MLWLWMRAGREGKVRLENELNCVQEVIRVVLKSYEDNMSYAFESVVKSSISL